MSILNRYLPNLKTAALAIGTSAIALSVALPTAAELNSNLMEGLKARNIGPAATSGRITDVDVDLSDTRIIYVSTAAGGVWKTEDAGLTWDTLFDTEAVASVGTVKVDQSNPDIIWAGTGENSVRNSTSIGGGVYKSIDGGETWTNMGLEASERISRIAIDPTDSNTVYVAALGTLWGPNETRGVYKTTDGGKSWSRILYVDEDTGAVDIKMDPSNPNKLYAAMWEFRRWPYFFKSGGDRSGLYVSDNGGESWRHLTVEDGIPAGELGRSVFAVSPSQPKTVYAMVEAEKSQLIRSDNGGKTWRTVNDSDGIMGRPFYYTEFFVDPKDPETVYNVESNVFKSINGGKDFDRITAISCCAASNTIHIDTHAMWLNPSNPDHLIVGNDGGIAITRDGGDSFRFVSNMPVSQFYHINVDNEQPYNVYGGLQDNGSWRGPTEVWENGGIRNLHWQEVSFGDGFDARPMPDDATRGYSMSQGGNLRRWDLNTGEQKNIAPNTEDPDLELRFNWSAALAQDPFDADTIYYGSQFVHKSTDRGDSWTIISPDLTTNNPEHQTYRESGGLTFDVTAAENYTTLVSLAASPLEQGVIWSGSDDGRVHITRDGGANWESIEGRAPRRAPKGAWVPMIEPSPHDAGTAFVVLDDHRRSNMGTYVYKVENYGRKWTSIVTKDISGYALSIKQDPIDPNLLFLGTEFGLYVSTNAGKDWTKWTAGVPTTSVMDLAIQERESDLVLGTHGRSIFVIDDYSGLRGLGDKGLNERLQLLSLSEGTQYLVGQTPSTRFTGDGHFRADNQPYGVMVTFAMSGDDLKHPDPEAERTRGIAKRAAATEDDGKSAAPEKIKVSVATAAGDVVRTFTSDVHQGINRIVWNTRADGAKPLSGNGRPDADLPSGFLVPPGNYTVTLSYGDDSVSGTARVTADPRVNLTQADYEAGFAVRSHLIALQNASREALGRVLDAAKEIGTIEALAKKAKEANDSEDLSAFMEELKAAKDRTKELEGLFRQAEKVQGFKRDPKKVEAIIGDAFSYSGGVPGRASEPMQIAIAHAERALASAVAEVNAFFAQDAAAIRARVKALDLNHLSTGAPISLPDSPLGHD